MSHAAHGHGGGTATLDAALPRLGLVGAPNSGKSTLFNALTGLHAKTGNYPGVTVARAEGVLTADSGSRTVLEDLPGTYSLDPISPDEQVVADILSLDPAHPDHPDALLLVADSTTLRRGLTMVAHALAVDLPSTLVLTFGDELARRGGRVDVERLSRALGIPVLAVAAGDHLQLAALRAHLETDPAGWSRPPLAPPVDPAGIAAWTSSVLDSARHAAPRPDGRTRRIDDVLLHPVWGTLAFFAVMLSFFQVIFTVAAPLQALVEDAFGALGAWAASAIPVDWLARFVSEAVIGGVGGVVVFLPQILLLFLMISLLEGTGYMSRAAFLMDRVMGRFGLEGRAFVALLSSLACAVPGIMATRSLPSARDRLATMMAAPAMTCSARLPVYVVLISLLVPSEARFGPIGLQGLVMFALYVGGAVVAMLTAAFWSRVAGRRQAGVPFYMEMPPYRLPRARTVLASMTTSAGGFLRKVTSIILVTTAVLWVLLNLPVRSDEEMAAAGVPLDDTVAVAQYGIEHSAAAAVGHAVEPVFAPLGFDWRIDVGVLASLSAREVFVATLGQMAAAEDPEDPAAALASWTVPDAAGVERPLFTPDVVAALLVFFMLALQCVSTLAVMRRETGTWRWPALAFGFYLTLAWTAALLTRGAVLLLT